MRLESKLNVVKEYRHRHVPVAVFVVLAFTILIVRLAYLQITNGEKYQSLSEQNFVQERLLPPLRGRILDTKGRPLADNRPAYNVFLTPAFIKKDPLPVILRLEGFLNLSPDETARINGAMSNAKGLAQFREILVKNDISRDQLAILETNKLDLPGVTITPGTRRKYNLSPYFSHLIGYVGKVNEREMSEHPDYYPSDQIGKKGIESLYETALRGQYGSEKIVTDAYGRPKGPSETEILLKGDRRVSPVEGMDVVLSIDSDFQKEAEEIFGDRVGALVVLDAKTGWVLAWVSKPNFDPNKFADGISVEDWERYNRSILDPLMDKVVQASYYPGSTYKVVTVLTALEDGIIGPSFHTTCFGSKQVGNHTFRCWNRGGHGVVDLLRGVAESCDVFFYTLGEMCGYDRIYKMASQLGLGEKPGLGFNSETPGVLPTHERHEKTHGRRWFTGDTLSHVIGQGDLKVSPMQLALLYGVIANKGTLWAPSVVRGIRHGDGTWAETFSPKVRRKIEFNERNLDLLRRALYSVVNEPNGTGYMSRLISPVFSGKTGTSQVAQLPKDKRAYDDYLLKEHGWFVAYAPSDDPQIVVAAIVEHGEHGSWVAPLVRDVIAAWWERTTGEKAVRPPGEYLAPENNLMRLE